VEEEQSKIENSNVANFQSPVNLIRQLLSVHQSLTECTAVEKLVMRQGFGFDISVYLHQICKQYKI
jgi:hypothetical protein